jgi:hypothetical protein
MKQVYTDEHILKRTKIIFVGQVAPPKKKRKEFEKNCEDSLEKDENQIMAVKKLNENNLKDEFQNSESKKSIDININSENFVKINSDAEEIKMNKKENEKKVELKNARQDQLIIKEGYSYVPTAKSKCPYMRLFVRIPFALLIMFLLIGMMLFAALGLLFLQVKYLSSIEPKYFEATANQTFAITDNKINSIASKTTATIYTNSNRFSESEATYFSNASKGLIKHLSSQTKLTTSLAFQSFKNYSLNLQSSHFEFKSRNNTFIDSTKSAKLKQLSTIAVNILTATKDNCRYGGIYDYSINKCRCPIHFRGEKCEICIIFYL